jgi:hypothetical protein
MDIPIIMDKDVTVQVFEAKSEISKGQGIPPHPNATYHKKNRWQQGCRNGELEPHHWGAFNVMKVDTAEVEVTIDCICILQIVMRCSGQTSQRVSANTFWTLEIALWLCGF